MKHEVIRSVLSEMDCSRVILDAMPSLTPAMVGANDGRRVNKAIRFAYNTKFDSHPTLEAAFGQLMPELEMEPIEIACYPPGGFFANHSDGSWRSHSAVIKLNEGFDGGRLLFAGNNTIADMEVGDALIWENNGGESMHCSKPVVRGLKWVALCWYKKEFSDA